MWVAPIELPLVPASGLPIDPPLPGPLPADAALVPGEGTPSVSSTLGGGEGFDAPNQDEMRRRIPGCHTGVAHAGEFSQGCAVNRIAAAGFVDHVRARGRPPPLSPNARCYPAEVFTTSAAGPLGEGWFRGHFLRVETVPPRRCMLPRCWGAAVDFTDAG